MALIGPLLFLMVLGAADFGRALDLKIEMTGASRAGVRTGIAGGSNDIGNAVRGEPNSAIPDNTTAWGSSVGPGGPNDCSSLSTGCGDPNGCVAASYAVGQLACFAVRDCPHALVGNTYDCAGHVWGSRPASTSGDALEVLVVYRYSPLTSVLAAFAKNGSIYLPGDTLGVETY
jgi:hypothetical protein